jgi:hypothetical protein
MDKPKKATTQLPAFQDLKRKQRNSLPQAANEQKGVM